MASIQALQMYGSSDSNESDGEGNSDGQNLHLKPLPSGDSIASASQQISLKAAPIVASKVNNNTSNIIMIIVLNLNILIDSYR